MTSGWGPGRVASGEATARTGESRVQARGDGSGGRALRTGSALPLIQLVSLVLTLLCLAVVWVSMTANGVLVLATIFAVTFLWSCGVFSRAFWR